VEGTQLQRPPGGNTGNKRAEFKYFGLLLISEAADRFAETLNK
jgi:hypothetical protein